MFDALHDMGDPVGAARHIRETLAPGGTFMLVEPMAGDSMADNMHPLGQIFYAASCTICTPNSLSQEVGLGLGRTGGREATGRGLPGGGFLPSTSRGGDADQHGAGGNWLKFPICLSNLRRRREAPSDLQLLADTTCGAESLLTGQVQSKNGCPANGRFQEPKICGERLGFGSLADRPLMASRSHRGNDWHWVDLRRSAFGKASVRSSRIRGY